MPKSKKRRPSDCRQKIEGKKCQGKYKLSHLNNIPQFTCNKCNDVNSDWSKFYDDYLQLYKKKENWDLKKHQVCCILGFFCYMYEKFYNTSYIFVPQNPNPFGCKEIRDIWTLLAAFGSNAERVRKYIHWLFTKNLNKNTTITHFGYLNAPGLIRKYNIYAKRKNILRRESKLPNAFINWCKENKPEVFEKYSLATMNDLGAMLNYYNAYNKESKLDSELEVILMATKLGLIKDGKLNIG